MQSLEEDRRTAWVPDPLGEADFEERAEHPGQETVVSWISVPRPDGRHRDVPVLSWEAMARLHRACDGLRDLIDSNLAPEVCGYRRGGEPHGLYSGEYQRYLGLTSALAEDASQVIFADVASFFWHVPLQVAVDRAETLAGSAHVAALGEVVGGLEANGLAHLPSGYSDARMLANLVLSTVDHAMPVPFTRWVDDYRLFLPDSCTADEVVATLRSNLRATGLDLNTSKTKVVPAATIGQPLPLGSVYHPETDGPDKTRAELRRVFVDAVSGPAVRRRELRFVLPRMASLEDDFACDFAMSTLTQMPWDAPRLVGYLATFGTRPNVHDWALTRIATAAQRGDTWLVARLAPLAAIGAERARAHASLVDLGDALPGLRNTPSWGLALRVLSAHHHGSAAVAARDEQPTDARAALGALTDLGLPIDGTPAAHAAPVTSSWLTFHGAAPLPRADSQL